MNDIVRIGVVGAGSISVRGIMPHLAQDDVHDRVQMTAVCDPVPGRAEAAAEQFNIPWAFENYKDLLDSKLVDAVTIASPIGLHYEQGKMAIDAGIHTHFNKSMTTTVEEADDLIESAHILSNINPAWYFRRPGGGPLYDMTVYGLHALTGVLGPAQRVTALSGVRIKEREFRGEMLPCDMDDNTLLTLDFGQSLFGFVYGTAAGSLPDIGRFAIFGLNGSIRSGKLNGQPIDYPESQLEEESGSNASLPHVVDAHCQIQEAHVYEDIMQLVDWIRLGKPTLASAEHARHVIEIFDAGYRSAETGTAQNLRTTFETIQ